ncbi:MAG TPA: helix-turn-helix transcriptional regulator [Caulobacteraceae bacterium]
MIALRKARHPNLKTSGFAHVLGVTRLHLTSIESGRRKPSMQLALRWLTALGPGARMSMFGPLPLVEERIRAIKHLQRNLPEIWKAA